MSEFPTFDSLKEFMRGFRAVVKDSDLPFESAEEGERALELYGSKAVYLVTEYFIRKRMLSIARDFFLEAKEDNAKFVFALNRVYCEMGQIPNGIRLLAGYL